MQIQRCPECGIRLKRNYCDVCMKRVPFAGAPVKQTWQHTDSSSAHRAEAGHKCITFDASDANLPKKTFTKLKVDSRNAGKIGAAVAAVVLALLSLIPTLFSIVEDVYEDTPTPEYNVEAFAPESDLPVLQPIEMYNDGEISVMVESLGLYYEEPALSFLIENNSSNHIDVVVESVAVNGYMVDSAMFTEVDRGDACQAFLCMYSYDLEKAGVEQISRIDLCMRIYDRNSFDEIFYTKKWTMHTDAADTQTQSVDRSGLELYNDGSTCVLLRDITLSGYGDGEMEVFIENTSGSNVSVFSTGLFLNGQEAEGYLTSTLMPGTCAVSGVYIYDLENLDIQELAQIEEVTLGLQVEYVDNLNVLETYSESITFDPAILQ